MLHNVPKLLCELEPKVFEDKKEATIALSKMNIATVGEAPNLEVHYVDVLTAIIKYLFVKKYAGKVDGVEDALDRPFAENMSIQEMKAEIKEHRRKRQAANDAKMNAKMEL